MLSTLLHPLKPTVMKKLCLNILLLGRHSVVALHMFETRYFEDLLNFLLDQPFGVRFAAELYQ